MSFLQKIDPTTGKGKYGPLNTVDLADNFLEINGGIEIGDNDGLQISSPTVVGYMRGKFCCHTDVFWEHISVDANDCIGLDYEAPTGLILHGDPCFYYKVHIEGEWSKDAADNDQSLSFATSPIYVQFLSRANENLPWSLERSKPYAYVSGDTILVDEEFIYESSTDLYVAPNFSRFDDPTLLDEVVPIQNFDRFWMRLTVTKCKKSSWFNIYSIPADGPNGTSVKTGYFPSATDEGLPFDGYYEVHFRAKVTEEIAVGGTPASLTTSQTLELRGYGGTWLECDRSNTFIGVTPPNQDAAMGHSLQGSAFIYVSSLTTGTRDIEFRVTLPNGAYKTLVDGYAHVRYMGTTIGINRKD